MQRSYCSWAIRPWNQAAGIMLLALASIWASPASAQIIPADAKPTCTIPPQLFAKWFASGSVSLNGVVNPANSLTFPNDVTSPPNTVNCAFYEWAKQMFLWLNSPAPSIYGGNGRIFDSNVFYDVSPPDKNGNRHFIRHIPGEFRNFSVRAAQVGAHGLPVIMAKDGRMLEVEPAKISPSGKQLILNRLGKQVEIDRAEIGPDGKPRFFDKTGKAILTAKPIIRQQLSKTHTVQRFVVGGLPFFLDPFGNVVDVEVGQAGGNGVLEAQPLGGKPGSLIYYTTTVNDVYAYFLTGLADKAIPPTKFFPTTPTALNQIVTFAKKHGTTFPDPNALAVEIKSSWIDATNLPNLNSYITTTAMVPVYDTSNPKLWKDTNQTKRVLLALVGMHVVGSTKGHPEMIWATFEHFSNTPNASYSYVNKNNQTITVPQSTAGNWLFSANGSGGPFNALHMCAGTYNQQNDNCDTVNTQPPIVAVPPFSISASDTLRMKAWGASTDFSPNPADPTPAASNTEVISINNNITGMMPAQDIRNNYLMIGATWTIGGASPTGSFKPHPGIGGGNEVGTSKLGNSTMETYHQGADTLWATGSNCFSCHQTNTTSVSHVFGALQPLFK